LVYSSVARLNSEGGRGNAQKVASHGKSLEKDRKELLLASYERRRRK